MTKSDWFNPNGPDRHQKVPPTGRANQIPLSITYTILDVILNVRAGVSINVPTVAQDVLLSKVKVTPHCPILYVEMTHGRSVSFP